MIGRTQKLKQTWSPLSWVRIVVKSEVGVRSGADPCGACGLSARGLVLDTELLKGERKTIVS